MAETEKQTQQIIDDPCHVFVREWQFSLSCRVHADYSIRQKEFHTRWKDWQRFTWCCGMACLSFSLISPLSTSSLFVCLSLSLSLALFLCVSVTDWVKYHLSGECCLDWHEIRTDQLDSYMLFLLLLSGMRLWCTSIAWTRGNNNTEAYSAD